MKLSADFEGIKLHLDNLMGGGNFGEAINNLLNALGDFIWDKLKGFLFPLLDLIVFSAFELVLHFRHKLSVLGNETLKRMHWPRFTPIHNFTFLSRNPLNLQSFV